MDGSFGLSALMQSGNGPVGSKGPLTAGGAESDGDLVVIGNEEGPNEGGITHGDWEPAPNDGEGNGVPPGEQDGGPDVSLPEDRPDRPDEQSDTDHTPDGTGQTGSQDDSSQATGPDGADKPGQAGEPDDADRPDANGKPDEPANPQEPPAGEQDGEKLVALTFDDGPDKNYTTAILDILKEKGVTATFFVVGQQVKKNPDVLKRIADEGHAVGNHSYNHKDLSKLNKQQILEEMSTSDAVIEDALGFTPTLFRAPYGAVSDTLKNVLKANKRELIGWSVDTRDWAGTSPADMREMIRKETEPGGIILMHSFGGKNIKHTVEALPGIIDDLAEMGYTFVTADRVA
ncbi:polysaccharide deacetylase family protein [Paenibacillus sp. IB182493]|uniref:Polysaccharide deacetylase family protein n=2 Tax=Paenibacillus arenilitoris TaxID=2772299 RepID=A0A927CK00_9BACL|nr:polysaccharide deacetylase family protein [Paenibacillus arenilitoris]